MCSKNKIEKVMSEKESVERVSTLLIPSGGNKSVTATPTAYHPTDYLPKCRHFYSPLHLTSLVSPLADSLIPIQHHFTNSYRLRLFSLYIPETFSDISSMSALHQQDLQPYIKQVVEQRPDFPGSVLQIISESMDSKSCNRAESIECRDESAAFVLKMIAIAAILTAGVCGVAIPLLGKKRKFLRPDSNAFFVAKAFAAGVILATGFVHMLSDATSALTNPCLPQTPWSKFPFSGFVAMMASLATLVVDFVGTQFYEKKQEKARSSGVVGQDRLLECGSGIGIVPEERLVIGNGKVFGEEEGGGMHIVGIHAHAAHHRHSHAHGQEACDGNGHSHALPDHSDEEGGVRHVVVSQVLELGIVSHSVIIGLSLGVSQSPCTIRPLIAALSFHQFFEGFALGGCISQAKFKTLKSVVMACFFAITTPSGIGLGTGLASLYNPNSPRALVVEGILDSVSAGILIYMALVDLIAADFLSKRMSCNVRLQVASYFALFLGAGLMSLLAVWA